MSDEKTIIDLSKNKNQGEYFNTVLASCAGLNNYRRFAYGGAIRGGKTFVTLFILIILARKYANSRWHIVRKDMPALLTTTIPSFEKFKLNNLRWNRNPGNFFVEFQNGSRIYFKPESIDRDPYLSDFLGLETNGIFLEQAEELGLLGVVEDLDGPTRDLHVALGDGLVDRCVVKGEPGIALQIAALA